MRKTIKSISVLIILSMALAFAGCYFKSPDADKFKSSLEKSFDASSTDYVEMTFTEKDTPIKGCKSVVTYFGNGVSCTYYEFGDARQGQTYFDKYYETFEDVIEGGNFSGECKKSSSGSRGYVYFDGRISDAAANDSMFGTGDSYGGAYYEGNVVVVVITHSGSASKSSAEDFLKKVGYPSM
mgnify:CR=1 FL=1